MRAKAFPGEDPATLKDAEVVAAEVLRLAAGDFVNASTLRVNPL